MVRGEEEHWGVSWPGPQGRGPPGSQAARAPPAAASDLRPFQPRLEDTSKRVLHLPPCLRVWTRQTTRSLACSLRLHISPVTAPEPRLSSRVMRTLLQGRGLQAPLQGLRAPVEGEADSCLVPGPRTMLSTACGASLNPCLTVRQELSPSPVYRWDS